MTVAIGLVCSDGVIVASDSMASSGSTAREVCKVFAMPGLHMVWTASGAVYVIEEFEQALTIKAKAGGKPLEAIFREPDVPSVRSRLGELCKTTLDMCYKSALPFGINAIRAQHDARHPFSSDFLLGGFSRDTPWLLEYASDGQMNWHTTFGFAAVGSGGEFATVTQALMKHYVEDRRLTVDDGLLVAYRAIETTCQVSAAHVATPVWLAVSTASSTRVLDPNEVSGLRSDVQGWKQIEADSLTTLRAQAVPAGELPSIDDSLDLVEDTELDREPQVYLAENDEV